jgi:heme-degrading monooxygenase HmoA
MDLHELRVEHISANIIADANTLFMILEAVMLNVIAGREPDFEAAFATATPLITEIDGYISHELHRCLEVPGKYLLLVNWRKLEDHTVGFRQSPQYQQWKELLHHFYDPFPTVEHFERAI